MTLWRTPRGRGERSQQRTGTAIMMLVLTEIRNYCNNL